MNSREWTTVLAELRMLDEETARMCAITASLAGEGTEEARELHRFRAQHLEHASRIDDLFAQLEATGPGKLPEDVKGRVHDQARRIDAAGDADEAMDALFDAELLSAAEYQKATHVEMPQDAGHFVRRAFGEERAHVDWLQPRTQVTAAETRLRMGEAKGVTTG